MRICGASFAPLIEHCDALGVLCWRRTAQPARSTQQTAYNAAFKRSPMDIESLLMSQNLANTSCANKSKSDRKSNSNVDQIWDLTGQRSHVLHQRRQSNKGDVSAQPHSSEPPILRHCRCLLLVAFPQSDTLIMCEFT